MLDYKNIMVPVDFTLSCKKAISAAANHSEVSGSKLLIAHVIDATESDHYPGTGLTEGGSDWSDEKVELQLDALLDSLEIGYCDKVIKTGDTVVTLLEIIEEHNIDLVVMGTHRNTDPPGWARSITLEVTKNTRCDVLVLHT